MWIHSIHDTLGNHETSKYIIILLGNKIDLIRVDGRERAVKESEARELCQEYKIHWGGECSDKTFSESDFKNLMKAYAIKIYEKIGPKYSDHRVVKTLEKNKKKKKSWKNKSENEIKSSIDPKNYFDFSSFNNKNITKKISKYLNY